MSPSDHCLQQLLLEIFAATHQDLITVVTLQYADIICNSSSRQHNCTILLELALICMTYAYQVRPATPKSILYGGIRHSSLGTCRITTSILPKGAEFFVSGITSNIAEHQSSNSHTSGVTLSWYTRCLVRIALPCTDCLSQVCESAEA